ncbi:hypothetical protein WOLCODRAFT_140470 [Wolfiporia cocos MD-104 SS10]|uniref:Uncharacterized protein n=1 Tax=Wolfiporia cocos (strain MD-104) TaxID=742152 RepID=A0A2H3J2S8_WOLCO|nr:hypothetical protein WOLCODRAFT_140470 [Wolfiporia cocos MD-104 SS10]
MCEERFARGVGRGRRASARMQRRRGGGKKRPVEGEGCLHSNLPGPIGGHRGGLLRGSRAGLRGCPLAGDQPTYACMEVLERRPRGRALGLRAALFGRGRRERTGVCSDAGRRGRTGAMLWLAARVHRLLRYHTSTHPGLGRRNASARTPRACVCSPNRRRVGGAART